MSTHQTHDPVHLAKRPPTPFVVLVLVAFSVLTGLMLLVAVFNLLSGQGPFDYLKAALIATMAALVSFSVIKLAIERGAELAATGFRLAAIVSVASILAVGAGLFPSTYAGLVLPDVEELQLQQYLDAQSTYVGQRNAIAGEATRLVPAVSAGANALASLSQCEIADSCLSGRGNGGAGPVYRVLSEQAGRASQIVAQVQTGAAQREASLSRLNQLIGEAQAALGDESRSIAERRQHIVRVDAQIDQELARLDEALPVALLGAYAQDLSRGVTIPDRADATSRLNEVLASQGQALGGVVASLSADRAEPPVLPARAGVSTTFAYLGHFLPIAVLAAAVELVFPISLWVYTLLAIVWTKHKLVAQRDTAAAVSAAADNDDLDNEVSEPDVASEAPAYRNGHDTTPRRRGQVRGTR